MNKSLVKFGPFNLSLMSLLAAFLGQYFMYVNKQLLPGLFFFAVGAVIFVIAAKISKSKMSLMEAPEPSKENFLPLQTELIMLGVIILIAVLFRVFNIWEQPSGCYRDEGQNGNEAINIMNGLELPVYIDRNTQNAAAYMYLIAAFFKFFGIGVMPIRAVSIVLGVLTIPAFFFFARYIFGSKSALLGALLLALTRWHVNFSRVGFLGVFTVFLMVVVLYYAVRVYREKRTGDFIMLGFTSSLSLYTYIAARLIPPGLVLFGVYILFTQWRFYTANIRKVFLLCLVFIITFIPFGVYIAKNFDAFMRRTATVSIFNKDIMKAMGGRYTGKDGNVKSAPELYLENLGNTLMMFNWYGDGNPRHNTGRMPMLDFASGMFFMLGFGFALYNWKKPFYFFLLSMLFALLQAGMFSIESPQAYRTIAIIPIIIAFCIIYLHATWRFFCEQYGVKKQAFFFGVAAAVFVFIAFDNANSYFNRQGKDPGAWAEFSVAEWAAGKYAGSLPNNFQIIASQYFAESYTFRFMAYPKASFLSFDQSEHMPVRAKVFKDYAFILDDSYEPVLPLLQKMYPGGKYSEFRHKFNNRLLFFGYEVPYEAVKKYQDKPAENGLLGHYYLDDSKKDLKDINNHWNGPLAFPPRVDPFIMFNWTVDPIYPVYGKFSIKWTGRIKIDKAGQYMFTTKSNDYSDVFIDGKQVVKNPGGRGSVTDESGAVDLSKGFHAIMVRYYESENYSKMHLWWRVPGADAPEVVPSEVLFPK